MSGANADSIFIRAASKSNGITSIVFGAIGLVIAALWLTLLPEWLFLAGIFIFRNGSKTFLKFSLKINLF